MNLIESKKLGIQKSIHSLLIEWKDFENLLDSSTNSIISAQTLNQLACDQAQKSRQYKSNMGLAERLCNEVKNLQNPINEKLRGLDLNKGPFENLAEIEEMLTEKWKGLISKEYEMEKLQNLFEEKFKEIEGKETDTEFSRICFEERAKKFESRQKQLDDGFRELELKEKEFIEKTNKIACSNTERANELELRHKQLDDGFRRLELKEKEFTETTDKFACSNAERAKEFELRHKQLEDEFRELELKEKEFTEKSNKFVCSNAESAEELELRNKQLSDGFRELELKEKQLTEKTDKFACPNTGFLLPQESTLPSCQVYRNVVNKKSDCRITFWRLCPSCNYKFKHYKDFISKVLQCEACSQPFTAYDLNAQDVPQAVTGSEDLAPDSSHFVLETTSTVKGKHKAHLNAEDENQMLKEEIIFKESGANPAPKQNAEPGNVYSRKRYSQQKQQNLSFSEDLTGNIITSPEKGSRGSKSEICKVDKKKNEESYEAVKPYTKTSHVADDSESSQSSTLIPESYPVTEFSDFEKDREEQCFSVNQIWAIYDTINGMPRFYAYIRKVFLPDFKLKITWLEPDPNEKHCIDWLFQGLPISCGNFVLGNSEEISGCLIFSHQIYLEKGGRKASYSIYPRKGDIWALFKDWDIGWSSDPENYRDYTFEVVDILSDFHQETGIKVCYLAKVKGFSSVFERMSAEGHLIPSSELLRFSHKIPSSKLTGTEKGVPAGAFELDTAALPTDPDKIWQPEVVKMDAQSINCRVNPTDEVQTAKRPRGSTYQSCDINPSKQRGLSVQGNRRKS